MKSIEIYKNENSVDSIKTLKIIHFNDIYNIDCNENEDGGAARFLTAIESLIDENTIVLFSGDALSPSDS